MKDYSPFPVEPFNLDLLIERTFLFQDGPRPSPSARPDQFSRRNPPTLENVEFIDSYVVDPPPDSGPFSISTNDFPLTLEQPGSNGESFQNVIQQLLALLCCSDGLLQLPKITTQQKKEKSRGDRDEEPTF